MKYCNIKKVFRTILPLFFKYNLFVFIYITASMFKSVVVIK